MVAMKRSRLPGSIDYCNDVKRCRNVKRNSVRDLMTVGLNYFMKGSVRRDLRVIEDSRKDWENSDLYDADPDYLRFLTSDLMSFKKTQDNKAISIDGSNVDPQYEMFLSCLKPYGTSCILEVSEANGLSEPIIYGLGESDELLKLGDRVLRSHNMSVIPSKDCLVNSDGSDRLCKVGLQEDVVKVYPSRSKNKVTETKKLESKKVLRKDDDYASIKVTETKTVESNKVLRKDDDYASFLRSNLIGQHVPNSVESNKVLRKDDDYASFLRSNLIGQHVPVPAESSKGEKRYALRRRGKVNETRKTEAIAKKNDEYAGRIEGLNVISQDQPDLKEIHEADMMRYEWDDDTFYVAEDGVCFFTPKLYDDVRYSYHNEDEDEDEDEDVDVDKDEEDDGESSDFRTELIEELRKPYNDMELRELNDKIRARKPIDWHRDLRHGRETSVPGDKIGESYLDIYDGLRQRLEMADDSNEKQLNLLRGFFFWLQKLTRADAFLPWNDTECLAVLPQAVMGKRKQRM